MTTTLSEGVKVPDVGSVNWAGDLEINWNLLNGALANLSGNVKLDRDNIWTGEQSFTLPIVGSITGTASKAIADEDGTSIKTGYVNVAGNQTVTGDKSFTGSNTFNNILPNATNTYSLGSSSYQWSSVYAQTYYYNGTAWGLDKANVWRNEQTILQSTTAQFKLKNSNIAIGDEVPSSIKTLGSITFTDSNGFNMGFMDLRDSTLGNTFVRILARQKYDANGNRSASGTTYESGIDIGVLNDKTPCVVPTSNAMAHLGTSTNQWKSVYSQTYYYNGTQWGLDKSNTWTQSQTFTADTIYRSPVKRGTVPPSNVYMEFADYKDSSDNRLSLIGTAYEPNRSSNCCIYAYKTTQSTGNSIGKLGIGCDASGNVYTIAPTPASSDDSTQIATTAYVKSQGYLALNGINPGALSLPDVSNWVSIDTTNWDKTGADNSYTPPVDGWISIITDNSSAANYIRCAYDNGDILAKANGNGYAQGLSVFLPVLKNVQVGIRLVCTTIGTAKLYPMLGNV